jgi:DNA processing protein
MNSQSILALLNTPGVGRRSVQQILAKNVASDLCRPRDLRDLLLEARSTRTASVPSIVDFERGCSEATRVIEEAESQGVTIISSDESRFPFQVRAIPDPPVVLYVKGELSALAHPAIAVVGTRDPSSFGAAAAERLGANLGAKGFVVVSGLAQGCDTAAHEGCLQARGITVAVLAHGLDSVYPAKNRKLANSIVDSGGALVSEYAPGTKPRPSYFVERDRLQSALSLGVIVVETEVEGGTMHTAGFAVKQQRRLACLVHPPKFAASEKARGNRKLIKESGAFPLEKKEDLDAFIALLLPREVAQQELIIEPQDRPKLTPEQRDLFLGLK